MKNATVTIDYESFQAIKEKADKYDASCKENKTILDTQSEFVDKLCTYLDLANEQTTAKNKQFFIAQGIRTFCEHYEMDVEVEYEQLDDGVAPKGYDSK
ncbi:hypothetical protein AAGS61_02900 [Lysinibacillus sp. KU-BSD001]|uniref:hypothetical protein n=1 Tax=Lysinibacillus sp. KU-BSD001 TaxID=3141328 RepID=UPI0036F054B0